MIKRKREGYESAMKRGPIYLVMDDIVLDKMWVYK